MAKKILVVDDNVDAADTLTLLLRNEGHDVHTAYGGRDAIEIADHVRPDVVLLDVDDPRVDGPDLVRQVRVSRPDAVVVVTMSLGRGDVRDAVLAAGAAGVVRKNVTVQHTFDQLWAILTPRLATDPATT